MARTGIGVDIGTDGVRVVVGAEKKGAFHVQQVVLVPLPRGTSDDADEVGSLLKRALAAANVKGQVNCGLTGRDVVIRYSQVPPVPDWQLRQLMEFEIQEMTDQSGDALSADFNLIPVTSDLSSDDTVLLALAKQGVLDHHMRVLERAGLKPGAFTPNSIALYNAFRKLVGEEGTTLLVNIGARSTDMALAKDGDILFARNLSGGGELFDDALVASFNVSADKARRLKEEMADVAPFDQQSRRTSQEEKVARALSGATGQLFSMVQSSVLFARSQTGVSDLHLDRVLLSGGGARLKGLDRYLASNLNVPVERFDPFEAVDVSSVQDDLDEGARLASVVALGLALQGVYDDVYSIEILPESVRKAKRFQERTVFAALAGVLALVLLLHDAWQSRADHAAAAADSAAFRSETKKRTRDADRFSALKVERIEKAGKLELLEERLVAGLGLERTLTLVQRYLPEDLYATGIEIQRAKDPDLGILGDAKPVVVVRGEGREGAEGLEALFNRFAQDVAQDPLLSRTPKTRTSPAGPKKPFEWTVTMNFSKAPPAASEDSGAGDAEEATDGSE